jgi:hypothetical protein
MEKPIDSFYWQFSHLSSARFLRDQEPYLYRRTSKTPRLFNSYLHSVDNEDRLLNR